MSFKSLFLVSILFLLTGTSLCQTRTIHVFVALCDNENQGIVPVPAKLGNGKDPARNLYWGAMYGVKSFFRDQSDDWKIVRTVKPDSGMIMERVLMKHISDSVFLLAEAYDGEKIKECTEDFLKAANKQGIKSIVYKTDTLHFGGKANLVAYTGHDGLMEFSADLDYQAIQTDPTDAIVLTCISEEYFLPELKMAGASSLLLTTGLMAPEAYTLEAAIDGWIRKESHEKIRERAAQAYHLYQKCGIKGARNLFSFSR